MVAKCTSNIQRKCDDGMLVDGPPQQAGNGGVHVELNDQLLLHKSAASMAGSGEWIIQDIAENIVKGSVWPGSL